jgi:Ca-activated chloride channel homolog
MIWIYTLTWQEWMFSSLFLLFSATYLYRLNNIARHLKTTPHTRVYLKFILRSLVILCAIVALLGPSFGYIKQDQLVQSKNWHVYVDVSKSMASQDVLPSRLEDSKKLILQLSDKHPNDLFALGAFGPNLQTLCPLTSDRDAFQLFLNQLSTTIFKQASSNGKNSFKEILEELSMLSKEENRSQSSPIVLIVSDGEFHTSIPPSILSALKALPFHYIVVGSGSSIPSPVPVGKTFLKDEEGRKVMTQLDRAALRQIANDLRGTYFDARDLEKIEQYTLKLPGKSQVKDYVNTSMNKYFYFLVLSALFMVLDIIITVKTMSI